jgi:hypothetical protein
MNEVTTIDRTQREYSEAARKAIGRKPQLYINGEWVDSSHDKTIDIEDPSNGKVIGQIVEWLGWMGSGGGPENASTPLGIVVLLTPSILLGSSFLVLLVALHQATPTDKRVWSLSAVVFGTAYALLVSMTYFVQLTLVAPRIARGEVRGIEMFLFVPFNSFLYAVDILGYSFMSVATLFAALAFTGRGLERVARWFLIANGLLIPFLVLQMYFHWLIWPAALWAVTFPGSTWALALLFRRAAVVSPITTVQPGYAHA